MSQATTVGEALAELSRRGMLVDFEPMPQRIRIHKASRPLKPWIAQCSCGVPMATDSQPDALATGCWHLWMRHGAGGRMVVLVGAGS